MAKTVIGWFDNVSEAQRVFHELVGHGFEPNDISIIAHQERAAAPTPDGPWAPRTLSISGVGPVWGTGSLAAALADVSGGPTATSLLTILEDRGVPADEAQWYVEGVHRGGALVSVDTGDASADRVVEVMNNVMQPAQRARGLGSEATGPSRKGEDMETIERSIDVNVPVQTAYRQWTQFEEFPRFMEGVEEVRRLDAKRLHWVASIGGTRKEWDAQITEEVPNERLAWRSEAGEFTAGVVTFQPLAADRVRLNVRFDYEPHGVKETVGDWLGVVSRRVEGDLERFKEFVEAHAQEPAGTRTSTATLGRPLTHTAPSGAAAAAGGHRFEAYEADFQQHCHTAYARSGQPYEHWAPAYRYGYTLATDPRYSGRDWAAIEADARRDWEQRHQGGWDASKDAVRYAWEHVRNRHGRGEAEVRIPIVEEKLQVGTRPVEHGGVRVHSRLTETPVEQQVTVREEHVHVERHPVDRPASDADLAAFKEGTIEVTETTEEPVVRRQARVVEEVVVSKDVEQHTETIRDTVRQTEVEVEPVKAEASAAARDFTTYEGDFRTHATTAFSSRGRAYEHWAPAYRYGYDLAADPRYRGRDWAAIETDARRDWEQRHKGTWEEFKEAVRYAWEKVRGRR